MKKQFGFSMIEVIMVSIIVGILSSTAYFLYPGKTVFNLSAIADEIKTDIRFAQTMAMSMGASLASSTYVTVIFTSSGYTVFNQPTVSMPSNVTISTTGGSTLSFDSTGTPVTGSPSVITVSSGSSTRSLTINSTTGFVDG